MAYIGFVNTQSSSAIGVIVLLPGHRVAGALWESVLSSLLLSAVAGSGLGPHACSYLDLEFVLRGGDMSSQDSDLPQSTVNGNHATTDIVCFVRYFFFFFGGGGGESGRCSRVTSLSVLFLDESSEYDVNIPVNDYSLIRFYF